MNCKVSVISTVLNERDTINDLLAALVNQSRIPDEIIIVDGGSNDGTIDFIRYFAQKHNIVKFINESSVNIARGRNIGIEKATSPIVAVIDAGCRPDKTWLEELIRPFEEDKSIDVVSGVIRAEYYSDFEFYSSKLMAGGSGEPDDNNFTVLGRSAAFKKNIWAKTGGYPEWLYTGEDTLFEQKLRQIGAKIKLSKKSFVYWRPRKTMLKMAKMFYLYGKGNGRIGRWSAGLKYHIRNYLIEFLILIASLFYPIIFLMLIAVAAYFYRGFYRPIIGRVKKLSLGWKAEFYVPLIVYVRTLSYCLGSVVGYYEFRKFPLYRENLKKYLDA